MTANVLGVTGNAAAGKSALLQQLEALGFRTVDAHRVAHEALQQKEISLAVSGEFGNEVTDAEGGIDRARLADIAFANKEELKRLTDILYPVVRRRLGALLRGLREADTTPVAVEAPTLYEAECGNLFDLVATVEAPRSIRIRRCAERGWTAEELHRRERLLIGERQRRERSDFVIENTGDLDALSDAARSIRDRIAALR